MATGSSRVQFEGETHSKRVWINGEWGLRYYLESEGGLPLREGQVIHPGEIAVSSKLSYPIPFTSGGGVLAPIAQRIITSSIPLRLVALQGRAAYSTTMFGLRPFDISLAPIDQLSAEQMIERKPTLTDLPMNAPQASQQIVSGVYLTRKRTMALDGANRDHPSEAARPAGTGHRPLLPFPTARPRAK